ncbi:Fc.00g107190.m01.CDS01 [Cosmosporella sp. VM-42]
MSSLLYVIDPPEGNIRTEVNPPSSGSAVVPAGVATTVIAIIGVCLRLFTRTYVVKGVLGIDDYLSICGLGFSVAFLGVSIHLLSLGAGRHMWDVLLSEYSPAFLQTTIGATMTYAIAVACAKLSILTFYLRISPDRLLRRTVYGLIAAVCAYTLAYMLLIIFQCRPVAAAWDINADRTCIGYLPPMMFLSVANIVFDVVLLLLPIRIVLPLQIPVRQKISLGFLFATGGFICAVAIKRTFIMYPLLKSQDYTWKLPPHIVWSFIEVNGGLFCASVPALKPLCVRYIPFLLHSPHHSVAEKTPGYNEKRKSGRKPYSQSYELPSRDEMAEGGRNDDEAQLWSTRKNESVDTKQDSDSLDSISDKFPIPARPAPIQMGFSTKRVQNVGGIQITKETHVSYT